MRVSTSSHGLSRRQIVAALLAGGLAHRSGNAPAASRGAVAAIVRQWSTDNEVLAPLTWSEGHVFFAGNQTLGRIDPAAKGVAWSAAHGFSAEAVFRPRVAGHLLVAGSLHELGAWDIAKGKRRWLRKAVTQMGVPCLTATHTYAGDGHALLALANADGSTLWRFEGTADTLSSYAPTVAGDSVLFAPGNGLLYAISARDGRLKWQLNRSDEWQYLRQLHVSGNVLVAGSYKELLYGISVSDGKVLWTFNAGNFINSHHVAGDTAYLWSPTGWIYAIDIANGNVRWRHQTTNYGQTSTNWAPMMAELVTAGDHLFALDMANVLHVLSLTSGAEIVQIRFPEELRPTVLAHRKTQAFVATEYGAIQQVRW